MPHDKKIEEDDVQHLGETSGIQGGDEPSGDLAYLTANVSQADQSGILWGNLDKDGNMTGVILGTPAATSTPRPQNEYSGKGKGIGKGTSGSSGPTVRRRQGRFQVPRSIQKENSAVAPGGTQQKEGLANPTTRANDGNNNNNASNQQLREPASETYIGVGIKRGSTIYPSYLFDVPPKKLKIDHLRRKFMITEIARSRTERRFYRRAITFISCMKDFFRKYAEKENFASTNVKENAGDHDYAMAISESSSEEDNTDFEGEI